MDLSNFPNLAAEGYTIQSPCDAGYNCIAWAVDDYDKWWWPHPDEYWPVGVPVEVTVDAFVLAFGTLGYVECKTSDFEAGCDKVALYTLDSEPTHAAKQIDEQWWSSKIGSDEDILHTLDGLVSPDYGAVELYLRREARP